MGCCCAAMAVSGLSTSATSLLAIPAERPATVPVAPADVCP